MVDVSEGSLLDYILAAGGKVKNSEMLKTYTSFINHSDTHLRAKYREQFKQVIDKIAVVKVENDEKHLVLKKYKHVMQERDEGFLTGSGAKTHNRVSREEVPNIMVTKVVEWEPSIPIAEKINRLNQRKENEMDRQARPKHESEPNLEDDGPNSVEPLTVALDPLEKEWMQSAACGQLIKLTQLLQQDPSLASKRDFTSTALHWAAKHGNQDMATLVANAGVDINTKAHGYTPLHIAALHDHRHIIDLLINTYGAKENLRDYSGHLARQYLRARSRRDEDSEHELHVVQAGERRHRRLVTLFQHKKKWGSAEDLPSGTDERQPGHQLNLPAFRARKFSR